MEQSELIEEWVRRFKNADIIGLSELSAEDAFNHQITQVVTKLGFVNSGDILTKKFIY